MTAAMFSDHPELEANAVVVSAGADNSSKTPFDVAVASMLSAKAAVYSLTVGSNPSDSGDLDTLASRTGGRFLSAGDAAGVANIFAKATHQLANQFVVTYTSKAHSGMFDIQVAAAGTTSSATVAPGTVTSGPSLHPSVPSPSRLPAILSGA